MKLDETGFGLLLLVDSDGVFERTVTDGDIRRLIIQGSKSDDSLESLPRKAAITADESCSRSGALSLMDENGVNHIPVIDSSGRVLQVLERRDVQHQILLSTPHMGSQELEFIEDAFRTNWIAPLGPHVNSFEKELAEKVGIGHAAALNSGTAAIHLALCILGVERGDTVFCSTFTFVASANPILYQGAIPVFIDSEPNSWNMSPIALERALSEASKARKLPKAVIVVDLYGQSADMDPLLDLCNAYGVPIVEDAAESLGARYKGRACGSLGAMGVYSFNGNKIITTSGGGMLVSNNQAYVERARFLATQARDPARHYQHSALGYNYRMSNILAAIGRGQLQVLDERVKARRTVFERYRERLADIEELGWMPEPQWSYSSHWLSACVLNEESPHLTGYELAKHLESEMIEARPLWKPMHLQPLFRNCKYYMHGNISVSDKLFERGVCLPSGSNMSEGELDQITSALRRVLRPRSKARRT